MVDDVLEPSEVGVADRGYPELPSHVVAQPLTAPIGNVKGRIGEDEIRLEIGEGVTMEAALVVPGDFGVDALHGKVHLRQPVSGVIDLLAIDGNVAVTPAVLGNELL